MLIKIGSVMFVCCFLSVQKRLVAAEGLECEAEIFSTHFLTTTVTIFILQVHGSRVPIHVVSLNCNSPATITFLKDISRITKGR